MVSGAPCPVGHAEILNEFVERRVWLRQLGGSLKP
jgi:hypothetical protein